MAATAMGGSDAGAVTGTCKAVIMDPFGGLGSSQDILANTTGCKGALSTGIGFGLGNAQPTRNTSATEDMGNGVFQTLAAFLSAGLGIDDSVPLIWRIGGPTPTLGIAAFGNGAARDDAAAGTFPMKVVTAVGTVANGAVVEAGWVNRTDKTIVIGNTVFGSSVAVQADP